MNIIADHSKFWLGDKYAPKNTGEDMSVWQLAAYRRAIANFVFIMTGKNIPVRFAENEGSLTDGKMIFIGGELSKGEFDPTVGLSLHEAMHIAKSDFNLIKLVWGKVPQSLNVAAKGKFTPSALAELAKFVFNVVEDRYIDAWAYEAAPGYRGYYDALYARYFYIPEIGEALKSAEYREPNVHNYKFRVVNMIHPDTDLDALPGLRKIHGMFDIKNILRPEMGSPPERLELAFQITEEIVRNIVQAQEDSEKKDDDGDDSSDNDSGDGDSKDSDDNADDSKDGKNSSSDKPEDKKGDEKKDSGDNSSNKEEPRKMSQREKQAVENIINKQNEFISREVKQKAFDSETLKQLKALENSDSSLVEVGGEEGIPRVNCILVKNLSEELMNSGQFPYSSPIASKGNPEAEKGVAEGIALGKMLGRRLQIRNEARVTKFNRLPKGKIDKRQVSALGYEGENIFYQTATDKYKNVHLHVSVDASSSMAPKWRKTMATVVAMAKAASMINNVSMSISFRSGWSERTQRAYHGSEVPYIVIAYDSRKDKFSKITQLFPHLFPQGTTPEGLAFQGMLHCIPAGTHELDSYFVNVSDGEPMFHGIYSGESAALHTKKQINKIREMGVSVLSYFVEEAESMKIEENSRLFRTMYGKDAHFIDVENVTQIAYTMNKTFLAKEK